jgi:hypothetical protein
MRRVTANARRRPVPESGTTGSPAVSEQPLPAKALIDFLSAPAAAPVYKAKGMEPG